MRKFIPSLLELTICLIILLSLWHGPTLWEWAAGYPRADDRLLVAATAGDREMFENALAEGASVNACDECGVTALMTAAALNRVDLAQRLIERGVDVNAVDNFGGTALVCAAEAGGTQMIQLLLEHGADASHRCFHDQTPAEIALVWGHADAAEILANAGALH